MPEDLQAATQAVDAAWSAFLADPTAEAEARYDAAHADWKALGVRGVGRPASGDSALSSTARAAAARGRQQQSAERWERVAPAVQTLRQVLAGKDPDQIRQAAQSVVRATETKLMDIQVIHAQPDSDTVVLQGFDGSRPVVAFVQVRDLDDLFHTGHLSGKLANLVVDTNLSVFARIVADKYERGDHRPYARFGATLERVDITSEDLQPNAKDFSSSVLQTAGRSGWTTRDGHFGPA